MTAPTETPMSREWWLNLESLAMGEPVLGTSELVRRGYAALDVESSSWYPTRPGLIALGAWLAGQES